jgi:DNA replication protein DnaC
VSDPKKLADSLGAAIESWGFTDWDDARWAEQDARAAAARQADLEREEQKRRKEHAAACAASGFPDRALAAAAAADLEAPAMARIRGWDPREASVLVLSGPPGCGKTVAATWWALQRSWAPTFVRATSFAASSRYDRDTRERWLGANALVLDDLGTEYADAKGSFLTDLDELIDTFYGDRRPLVITTNLKAEDFRDRYGARIVDRIRESGRWESIAGASLRRRH